MALKIKITPDFINQIEEIRHSKNVNYIDALIIWCEENNFDPEILGEIIKKNKDKVLQSKIQVDAEDLNFMPKGSRLPI